LTFGLGGPGYLCWATFALEPMSTVGTSADDGRSTCFITEEKPMAKDPDAAASHNDTGDLDPRDTDHPAGEQHAAENAANDPPA
jgi:hypothetical protein